MKSQVQQVLFDDPEWQRYRPNRSDGLVVKLAIDNVAKKLHNYLDNEHITLKKIAKHLNTARMNVKDQMNGYQIAKSMEKSGYSPDQKFVDICSSYKRALKKAKTQHVREWVIEAKVEPKKAIGDLIFVKIKNNIISCKIKGIDREMATYKVSSDQHKPEVFYINFEEVLEEDIQED